MTPSRPDAEAAPTGARRVVLLTQRFRPARHVSAVRWSALSDLLDERGFETSVLCRRFPSDGSRGDPRVVLEVGGPVPVPVTDDGDGAGAGTVAERAAALDAPDAAVDEGGPRSIAVRLNRLAVPDTAGIRWWRRRHELVETVRALAPDVIVSTSPPHSLHLVAAHVARRVGVPHVVEFRDPYVGDRRYDTPSWPGWRAANRWVEARIIDRAAAVLALSPRHGDELVRRHPGRSTSVHVVPNGFHAPLPGEPEPAPIRRADDPTGPVRLAVVATAGREELALVARAAAEAWPERTVELVTIGVPSDQVRALREVVEVIDHPWVPPSEVPGLLVGADALLLLLSPTYGAGGGTSTKLYQYLAAGRPIVAVNPTAADRDLLDRWGRSVVLDRPSSSDARVALRSLLDDAGAVPDGRAFTEAHAWSVVADRVAQVLGQVIDRSSAP